MGKPEGKPKRTPTQSADRKKKHMQRSRKQVAKKKTMKKGSWVQAIKSKYERSKAEDDAAAEEKDEIGFGSTSTKLKGKTNGFKGEDGRGGVQVEDEVDEEKMGRMNKVSPLECQLFLKGCPSDVTEDQLRHFFVAFGNVKKCFQVKNAQTSRATGSAFIHFKTVAEADAAYAHAQQNAREVATAKRVDFGAKTQGLSHHQAKRMAYKKTGDLAGGTDVKDPFITINDSRIIVHRVLSRTDSQEATGSMTKKKKRTRVAADDPRNLFLLQEGMIFRDSDAATGLSDRYLQQLEDDYNTRKTQLKDINHYVSRVRLSFRNVPKTVDNAAFRKLVLAEARGYFKAHPEDIDTANWGKHGPIKNIKIVLDQEGDSRGFGFCELATHGSAIHVLRRLNNNPNTFGPNRRLIVSFAIENVNAVQKLQQIREIRRTKRNRGDGEGNDGTAEGEDDYSGN